jgi:hypothetical protein
MKKKLYQAPCADVSEMLAYSLICDSLVGGISDYDLVDGYEWED